MRKNIKSKWNPAHTESWASMSPKQKLSQDARDQISCWIIFSWSSSLCSKTAAKLIRKISRLFQSSIIHLSQQTHERSTDVFSNELLYDCMRNNKISKIHKFDSIRILLEDGAAPVYFDAAGMTALYFIDSIEMLELYYDTFKDLFRWRDWWGR